MLGAIVILRNCPAAGPERVNLLASMLGEHADRVALFGGAPLERVEHVEVPRHASDLAVLATLLAHAREAHAMVLSADLRHPSTELLRYLASVRAGHEAVVPVGYDDRPQPFCAIYHSGAARRAAALVSGGDTEVAALLRTLAVRLVTAEEVAKFGDPAELLARDP